MANLNLNTIQKLMADPGFMDILQTNDLSEILKGDIKPELYDSLMSNNTFKDVISNADIPKDNSVDSCCTDDICDKLNEEEVPDTSIKNIQFTHGDKVKTINLKNELYNDKDGIVDDYNCKNNRYIVSINNNLVAIKDENLCAMYDTIENID